MRPPLMTQGQANDWYAYTSIGTGLMWLAGGVALGPAAVALGLCGAAAAANNNGSGAERNNPHMQWQPPAGPPGPLDVPPHLVQLVSQIESALRQEFGENAVHCWRTMVVEGWQTHAAYSYLCDALRPLVQGGNWQDGRIQGIDPSETPTDVLRRVAGGVVVVNKTPSPHIDNHYWNEFWGGVLRKKIEKGEPQINIDRALVDVSMFVYILGCEPITDKPVKRIKVWINCNTNTRPVFYACNGIWYYFDSFDALAGRWNWMEDLWLRTGTINQEIAREHDRLFYYRVEEHYSEGPPGDPDPNGLSWSAVLFGRKHHWPASEEDMRGLP